jgi:DNA-binding XRE family transcriptional regulator
MDAWDLKKWRRKLGYNQFEAAQELGVGRASIQNWEQERWPIPRVTELACQKILRCRKQRPDFGPVLVIYADGPIWQRSQGPYQISILQCELYENNEIAMQHVNRLRDDPYFINPFIMDETGEIIWTPSELPLSRRLKTQWSSKRRQSNKA